MAELATGAVSTLLGVISNEARRLGRVRGDVQFIQEEMESMSSFLANLARNSREHNDQIRTWMNQVRILANDSNNCIDLYLYRGNPDFHLARRGLRRYLLWTPWLLRKMRAQHRAVGQLRELKERARDIGERRLRYGVKVKTESSSMDGAGLTAPPLLLAATQDHEEEEEEDDDDDEEEEHQDGGDPLKVALSMTTMSMYKEDYFKRRLDDWFGSMVPAADGLKPLPYIAFVVPETEDTDALVREAQTVGEAHFKQAREALAVHEDDGVAPEPSPLVHKNVLLVDVVAVHYDFLLLRPEDILYYILRKLGTTTDSPVSKKWGTYQKRKEIMREVKSNIEKMEVEKKIKEIEKDVCKVDGEQRLEDVKMKEDGNESEQEIVINDSEQEIINKPLEQLLWLLIKSTTAVAKQEQGSKPIRTLAALYDGIINKTAEKLKEKIEVDAAGGSKQQAPLYVDMLRKVFPRPTSTSTSTTSPEAAFEETMKKKMEEIQMKIKTLLKMQKIQKCLNPQTRDDERILVILKTDVKYVSKWEEARNTLSLLGLSAIAGAIIVATKTTQQDKEDFCYAGLELIEYSLVGRYLDTVLQHTGQHMQDRRHILHNILCECGPHEFCMKIFAHALYAKPKRSNEELRKLHKTLQATQKSLPNIARKMFKFSYRDLPKEYRSCLMYLAIFPQDKNIRRSTLVGRWVTEGLITTKDWSWSSSVDEAEKCFDTLVARCLVYPASIGATGKVKSCKVNKLVYGFITKMAMKQRILETRLSRHLARHFSIFSDVHLRSSEKIEDFLKNIPKSSSQFSKLKVLDLEGCCCFAKNKHYLREICSKLLMLKYLSLRGTDATQLPSEINNLHELEVLDIRQTKIPARATRNVMLRKLKRLLAGHIDSSSSSTDEFSSVEIPEKIEKMLDVKVLSNVKPHNHEDLKDISILWQLKKLGVVINKDSHLQPLLEAIRDLLNQSLRSLSITLTIESTPPGSSYFFRKSDRLSSKLDEKISFPKVLESLSIMKSTQKYDLLTRFANAENAIDGNPLAKLTLSGTSLSQENLNFLAKLPKLRCVRLRAIAYNGSKLIVNKDGFQTLEDLLVEGPESPGIAEISFDNGAASRLKKIILSSNITISGVDCLPNLEELELNNIKNKSMLHSLLGDAKHITKVTLSRTSLSQEDLKVLAELPKLRCLALLYNSYMVSQLIFNEDEFQKLNLLIVGSSTITKISFTGGCPQLEKIVWSFTTIDFLDGIDNLPRLKELELNGDTVPSEVEEAIKRQKNRLDYIHSRKPEKSMPSNRKHKRSRWCREMPILVEG